MEHYRGARRLNRSRQRCRRHTGAAVEPGCTVDCGFIFCCGDIRADGAYPHAHSGATPRHRRSLLRRRDDAEAHVLRGGGYKDVPGQTVDVLFRKELVKLSVSRQKESRGRFIHYRYAIALTREGEWFAHAIMESECRHQSAIETIGAALRDGAINPDNFEDSSTVYAPHEAEEMAEI
jgi:hypothetical protein